MPRFNNDTIVSVINNTQPVTIGRLDSSVNFRRYVDGWVDNIRLTVGVARYTANFTPPAFEYPTS